MVLLGGSYNALSAARSLGRAGCQVHVGLEADAGGLVAASRHVTSWLRPTSRAAVSGEWLEWLRHDVPSSSVVIPCSDVALEALAGSRDLLSGAGLHPAEADDELVLALLDKQTTYERAAAEGFRVPRTASVSGVAQGMAAAEQFDLPFALKPRLSHRFLRSKDLSPKAVVISRRDELEPALRLIVDLGLPVILTEIVPGVDDEYCSYYGYVDEQGRELVHFTKRKLRQHPVGFGSGTLHVTGAAPEVAELGATLFHALGLRGIGNVEFKRDVRDGSLVLIECNLRLTAATELVRRAGVDFADLVYRRALGLSVPPVDAWERDLRQWLPVRDFRAFRERRSEGRITAVQWARSVARPTTFPVLDMGDLRPSGTNAAEMVRRSLRAAIGASAEHGDRGIHSLAPASRILHSVLQSGGGRLARILHSEAGVLTGMGASNYRLRWRLSSPLVTTSGRDEVYRRYWYEAADLVGARVHEAGAGLLRISRGPTSTLVWGSTTAFDDPLVLRIAGDKAATDSLLREAGQVPLPEKVVCTASEVGVALDFLSRTDGVVVKPAEGGGGMAVTCGVRSADELLAAFALALRASQRVIIERQVRGAEYRLLVVGGQVVSTVRRRPPSLTGDGQSSLGELVSGENTRRRDEPGRAGLYPLSVDLDMVFTLRRAGLKLSSVVRSGREVVVKTAVNENGPRDNDLVVASPALAATAVAAAGAIGAELAAIEIITPDASRPLTEVGGVVLEVNTTPGLHYHYQVTNPEPLLPVAAVLLERLLERRPAASRRYVEGLPQQSGRRLNVG